MKYYLKHHGIEGQRWGKRNGPPYPLDAEDYSAAEKRANSVKSELNKVNSESNSDVAHFYKKNLNFKQKRLLENQALTVANYESMINHNPFFKMLPQTMKDKRIAGYNKSKEIYEQRAKQIVREILNEDNPKMEDLIKKHGKIIANAQMAAMAAMAIG